MTWITPGIDFIIRNAILPAGFNYGVSHFGLHFLGLSVSKWILGSLSVLVLPVRVIAGVLYREWSENREAKARGARLPPRLKGRGIGNTGNLKWLMECWKTGYPGDGLWDIADEHGPVWNFRFLFTNSIFTISPEHIKLILATDFDNYVKGERFQFGMAGVLGSGVFNSDGDMWKFHRSMTRPFFNRDRVTDIDRFDRHAQNAIALLKDRMKTGTSIDFQDLMSRLTLDSASDFLFGTCLNSLQIPSQSLALPFNHPDYNDGTSMLANLNNPANVFSQAFLKAQIVIAERERNGWMWPLLEMFEDRVKEPMVIVNRFLEPVIQEAIQKNQKRTREKRGGGIDERTNVEGSKIEEGETLLDHLITLTSDPALLRDQTLNILIAGRDTVAATLTFMVYFLSLHPTVLSRLRSEILEKVGPSRRPTYEDVKEMKYLRAVINETLRLLPPVPWDVRESVKGAIWPSPDPTQKPIYIPPGSSTPYGVIMMHCREDLWGPDADEFDPDRFLDERLQRYLLPNPFIFLPFNAGPRICLGQQFAYNQISFVIIRLLQSFSSFSLDEEAFPPNARVPENWSRHKGHSRKAKERFIPKVVLTMYSEGGMWMKASQDVDEF